MVIVNTETGELLEVVSARKVGNNLKIKYSLGIQRLIPNYKEWIVINN